ncbi:MAG: hypothetical protein Q9163_004296 [Psora crenata]
MNTGGFKWKEKPTHDGQTSKEEKRLERGYRDTARPRSRSPLRDDVRSKFGDDYESRYSRKTHGVPNTAKAPGEGVDGEGDKAENKKKKKKEKKKAAGPRPTDEPMIIVNVNDRLGTKASIPCLASDPIRLFKAQVAARIGREPHEIMLKRQGERPFKDHLTLEDYGVSNGVQLDLEVDTGD